MEPDKYRELYLKYLQKNRKIELKNNIQNICYTEHKIIKYDLSKIFNSQSNYKEFIEYDIGDKKYQLPKFIIIEENIVNETAKHIKFEFYKIINQGSYGVVCLYKNSINEAFVIKKGKIDSDINIINYLKKLNICLFSYVNSKYISNFLIMEYMDGNLRDIVSKTKFNINLSFEQIIDIISILIYDFICLTQNKLIYTDIKLENILYRCNNDNTFSVILADIGSIINMNLDNKDSALATYPPANRIIKSDDNIKNGIFYNPNEKDVVWGVGIIILDLMKINVFKYKYDKTEKYYQKLNNLQKDIEADINSAIYKYFHYCNELMFIIKRTLEIDEDKRINLSELLEYVLQIKDKINMQQQHLHQTQTQLESQKHLESQISDKYIFIPQKEEIKLEIESGVKSAVSSFGNLDDNQQTPQQQHKGDIFRKDSLESNDSEENIVIINTNNNRVKKSKSDILEQKSNEVIIDDLK